MKNREQLEKSLIVCGPRGSGKTEFSKYASKSLCYQHINVGNLLLATLEKYDIFPSDRSEIGRLFIDNFGFDGYANSVLCYTENNVILDGIRIADIVLKLKKATGCKVIFRIGKNGLTSPNFSRTYDGFENELIAIVEMADLTIPWFTDISDLYRYIENQFPDNYSSLKSS